MSIRYLNTRLLLIGRFLSIRKPLLVGKSLSIERLLLAGSMSLATLAFVLGLVLVNNDAFAESSVVSTASITVPIACTMTGTGTVHAATLNPGTYSGASGSEYQDGIGKTTLTAICNDDNGFSIYAVGYTGDSMTGNNTKLIGSSTQGMIDTKAYASGDTASNWSMKVTKVTDSTVSYNPANMSIQNSFDSWHAVPSSYTKVAQYHANTGSSTTDTTLGAKVETTYAAYIATNQSADVYEGQVKYTLVHPYDEEAPLSPQSATPGCINYFANASDAVGTMGCQSAADGNSIDLLASNFSRTGYGFAGWSDSFDYATNAGAKFYGPMETITVPTGTTANGLSLYAVWIKSEGSIQDQSKVTSVCNRLNTAPTDGTANLTSVSALTDQRDNNTYAIAKLADGKCWMIENLRLDSTADHNSDGSLAQGYGTSATYGNFGGLADAESSGFSSTYTANSLYYSGTQSGDATINIGTTNSPGSRMPRYNNVNTSTRASNPTNNDGNMYSYGNYYTWHAAIADLTYNGTNNQSTTGTSLCPTGWHLPKGGSKSNEANNELWSLVVDGINGGTKPANYDSENRPYYTGTPEGSDASNKLRAYPNNFLYSGSFNTSSASGRGSGGRYRSSTAYTSSISYGLTLNSSSVSPTTNSYAKYAGHSIRCTVGSQWAVSLILDVELCGFFTS